MNVIAAEAAITGNALPHAAAEAPEATQAATAPPSKHAS
jgi:hypothetical protein